MANTNAPFGFRPIRYKNGAPYNGAGRLYHVASGNADNIFIGDPVKITGTSNTSRVAGFEAGTLAGIEQADAGDNLPVGIVLARYHYTENNLDQSYLPASTEGILFVADSPDLIFEIQGDATVFAATDIGLNADFEAGSGGSTANGLSSYALDGATKASTAALNCKILAFASNVDNEVGAYARFEVLLNQHLLASAQSTTGVGTGGV